MNPVLPVIIKTLRFFIIGVFCFSTLHCIVANNKQDSLLNLLSNTKNDTTIQRLYLELGNIFEGSDPDTAKYFYNNAIKLAEPYPKTEKVKRIEAQALYNIAIILQNQGHYERALEKTDEAEVIAKQFNFTDILASSENMRGLIYYSTGEFKLALAKYEIALEYANKANNKLIAAKVYSNMAVINWFQGNIPQAIELFKKPAEIGKELNNKTLYAGSLMNLGVVYSQLGYSDSSLVYYLQAVEIYKQMKRIEGLTLCYTNIGNIYFTKSDYGQALDYYKQSFEQANAINEQTSVAKSLHNIGEVYARLGDYEKALDYYLKALEIKEKIADKSSIATSYKSIGTLHLFYKNYEKSLEYYLKSLKIFTEQQNQTGIASAYSNLANVYCSTDSVDKGLILFDKAGEIYKRLGDTHNYSEVLVKLGIEYSQRGDYAKAEKYFKETAEIKESQGDTEGLALTYFHWADMEKRKHNLVNAIKLGEKAWGLVENMEVLETKRRITHLLSNAYSSTGDFRKAFKYSEIQNQIKDSLFSKEKTEATLNAEVRWQAEKKQQQIEQLEAEGALNNQIIARKEAESKWQMAIIGIVVLLFVFALIAILLLLNISRRKRDLQYQKQKASITKLKMQNIQNRISPHFFFNALTTATLPLSNFPEHKKAFDGLLTILKLSLTNAEATSITLSSEFEIVDAYLNLQKMKPGHNFTLLKDISMVELNNVQVPSMILQIPVENAIKHGLAPHNGDRELCIKCYRSNNTTFLEVKDNGVGRKNSSALTSGTGTGLKSLMQTIDILNTQNQQKITFTISDANPQHQAATGTLVTVSIPDNYNYTLN